MKLYLATVTVKVCIADEDFPDERRIVKLVIEEINETGSATVDVFSLTEIKSSEEIPKEWRGCIPRCDYTLQKKLDDRTVDQIIGEKK